MKTFSTLEKERLNKENERMTHLLAIYKDSSTDALTKTEISKRMKFVRRTIGNLSETVKIEIAKHANLLFNGIKESLKFDEFRNLYYSNIEEYLKRVSSLKVENKKIIAERHSGYNLDIQKAILFFGFTLEDLKIIMNKQMIEEDREEFMSFINQMYKTQIPTLEELRNAEERRQQSRSTLEQVKSAKEKKILEVRNGVYIQTEYPLYYEHEIISHYDELIEDAKLSLKRK